MSDRGKVFRNIVFNTSGYLVNALVLFFLTPYVIQSLGDGMAGIWLLIMSLVGHYGLLDLGIRSAIGYFVAEEWARRHVAGVNRVMSTAMTFLSIVALCTAVVTLVLWWVAGNVPQLLQEKWPDLTDADLEVIPTALLIMGLGFSANFVMTGFNTILYATQRHDMQNVVGVTQLVLRAGLTWWVLEAGHGIVGLAVVVTLSNCCGWIAYWILAHRLVQGLRISPWLFERGRIKPLFRYGAYNSLVNVGDAVLVQTDNLVIGLFVSPPAVIHYNYGALLIPQLMMLVQSVTWAFTPYATACYATRDFDALRRLLFAGTRGALALGTLIGVGMILFGEDFLRLWVGEEFVTGAVYTSSAVVLGVLSIATIVRAMQSCTRQILFGINEVKFLGQLSLFEASLNLVVSCILVRSLGLLGVALGTLIPVFLTQAIIQPLYVAKILSVSSRRFLAVVLRTILPIGLTLWVAKLVLARVSSIPHWGVFFLHVAGAAVPAVLVALFFVLDRKERDLVARKLRLRR